MKKRDQKKFQKALLESRAQLLVNAKRAITGDVHLDPDDFADEIDSASSDTLLAFVGRLRERERHPGSRPGYQATLMTFAPVPSRTGAPWFCPV